VAHGSPPRSCAMVRLRYGDERLASRADGLDCQSDSDYRRHLWILQMPLTRPPLEPGQLDWRGAWITYSGGHAVDHGGEDGDRADLG
jgi:hypothetical protein